MLARSAIRQRLLLGDKGDPTGISVTPSPLGFADKQIGGASLDLRLGRWFLSLQQAKVPMLDLADDDQHPLEQTQGRYQFVRFDESFVIHPGRFVLAATLEWVKLPNDLGAYITGKSALGRRGLIIETAAGIHPGFAGCLALEISNCGEIPISVSPGIRIAQLFFHQLEGDLEQANTSFGGRRKPVFGMHRRDVRLSQDEVDSVPA